MSPKGGRSHKDRRVVTLLVVLNNLVVIFLAGVNSLCQALCANPAVATALTHLDLSGNSLRGDDLQVRGRRAPSCLRRTETGLQQEV